MNKKQVFSSLRKKLTLLSLALMVLLLGAISLLASRLAGEMIAMRSGDMDLAVEQVLSKAQDLFDMQYTIAKFLSEQSFVQEYAGTRDTQQRYLNAFNKVRPLVDGAIQNMEVDHLILYDITNAWFQYKGALSTEDCRTLRALSAGDVFTSSRMVTLAGGKYLLTTSPLWSLPVAREPRKVGTLAILSDTARIASLFSDYEALAPILLFLHDGQTVLVSNREEWVGKPIGDTPVTDRQYYMQQSALASQGLTVSAAILKSQLFPQKEMVLSTGILVGLFALAVFFTLFRLTQRWFLKPIAKVIGEVSQIDAARPQQQISVTGMPHIDVLTESINTMLAQITTQNRQMITAQQALHERELNQQRMALFLLKKQINTHFLYNSLMGLETLMEQGKKEQAVKMADGIARILRYAYGAADMCNVFEEMEIIQEYILIMNLRYGGRFQVTYDVEDSLCAYSMPKLLLQPIVENAVTHGLMPAREAGMLHISGRLAKGKIVFRVSDTGAGMAPEALKELRLRITARETEYQYMNLKGVSLMNIYRRINTSYGEGYGLEVTSEGIQKGMAVTMTIPAIQDGVSACKENSPLWKEG